MVPSIASVDSLLEHPGGAGPDTPGHRLLGSSREDRPISGFRFGDGPLHVSLIAGCHADEPVGPWLLDKLVCLLAEGSRERSRWFGLDRVTWSIVPHVNPDGAAANAGWQRPPPALDQGYDLPRYLAAVVREPPGDDLEFGFPRSPDDEGARPETRAVAEFLRETAPVHLHATLHGMAFAAGPWFLLEPSWVTRTTGMRRRMRQRVRTLGYGLHDLDRGGEKGFRRIDEGFSTRPDSKAMAEHFRKRGDEATAELFRPSSMEFVRALGGDPLTLVSEMPLFLVDEPERPREESEDGAEGDDTTRPPLPRDAEGRRRFRDWLTRLRARSDNETVRREAEAAGVRPMVVRDQMRLQMGYVLEALRVVGEDLEGPATGL